MNPLEALSAAIGDELNDLAGGLFTRLQTAFQGEVQLQDGAGLLNASSVDTGVTVTFSSGALINPIPAGSYFRLLSDLSGVVTQTAAIASRDSATQLTLSGAGLGANFSGDSWEIYTPPETSALVESTLGFDPSGGQLFIDGTLYRYTSLTATSFLGMSYDDGTGTFTSGCEPASSYPIGTVVQDYTRNFSAIDIWRRSFFVRTATGSDLDVVGRNLGVERVPELSDTTYRAVIEAVAYTHRGTVAAMERALDALVGAGNWEIFEDLTGGRNSISGDIGINENNTVFVRIDRGLLSEYVGKTFVEGVVYAPANDAALDDADVPASFSNATGSVPTGVILPDDPFSPERPIASGSQAVGTISAPHIAVAAPTGSFPARIQRGDTFEILSGPLSGRRYHVQARSSDTALTITSFLTSETIHENVVPHTAFTSADWRIIRTATRCGLRLPSAETEESYPGSGSYIASWEFLGTGSEGASVALATYSDDGGVLSFAPSLNSCYYRHRSRIDESSDWTVTMQCSFTDWGTMSMTDHRQFGILVDDGSYRYLFGVVRNTATTGTIRFADFSTGLAAGAVPATLDTLQENVFHDIEISMRRDPTDPLNPQMGTITIKVDGVIVQQTPWGAVPTNDPAVDDPGINFGVFSTLFVVPEVRVRAVDWRIHTHHDFLNIHRLTSDGGTTGAAFTGVDTQTITGTNSDFVAGRQIFLHALAPNAAGGIGRGIWEFDTITTPNQATLVGPTYSGARTTLAAPDTIDIVGFPASLLYPNFRGMSIELLDGPDAGVYPISAILFADGTDIEANAWDIVNTSEAFTGLNTSVMALTERGSSVQVSGAPAGGFTPSTNMRWRIIPVFGEDMLVTYTIINAGAFSDPTVTLARPLNLNFDAGVYEPVVGIRYYSTLSAHVEYSTAINSLVSSGPPVQYYRYPFYLHDQLGHPGRVVLDDLTAAGVILDPDRLTRDGAGPHVL